jgi:hypothetical protein
MAIDEIEPGAARGAFEALESLGRKLREAGRGELLALVQSHAAELTPAEVRQIVRNPYCGREAIELVAGQDRLLAYYEVRRELALARQTPEALALRLVPGLWWRDLMLVSLDARLPPLVRRVAEQGLTARLPRLAVGEKVSLARRASGGTLAHLRHDPNPRVIAALLENPRLTEGLLLPLLAGTAAAPPVLQLIAADPRWGSRYPVRLALARNPHTPVETALRTLPLLRKVDLKALAADVRLPVSVRDRAGLLVGDLGHRALRSRR